MGVEKDERAIAIERSEIESVQEDKQVEEEILERNIKQRLIELVAKEKLSKNFKKNKIGEPIDKEALSNTGIQECWKIKFENENINNKVLQLQNQFEKANQDIQTRFEDKVLKIRKGDDLLPTVMSVVKVFVAVKRRLMPGDKMAGRHGNKGVISKIVPVEDMPYMENGKPVDIVLNPLGVPSRMNVGQILETHLGWSCSELGEKVKKLLELYIKNQTDKDLRKTLQTIYGETSYKDVIKNLEKKDFVELCTNLSNGVPISTPVFDGASTDDITKMLETAGLPSTGQTNLWDGKQVRN